MQSTSEVEVTQADTIAKLHEHKKKISTYLVGEKKGAAELFGYAFLAGREMLLAKDTIAHGNAGDPNAGLMQWMKLEFPKLAYRTCGKRMVFAREVIKAAEALPPRKKRPLQLDSATEKNFDAILKLMPAVMDGKSMSEFMRDRRLLKNAEKQKHHPVKITKQEQAKAKAAQARRVWSAWRSDSESLRTLKLLAVEDLQRTLDAAVGVSNKCRELLRAAVKAAVKAP